MRKLFMKVLMAAAVSAMLLTGCGGSKLQGELDALQAEYDALKAEND